MVRSRLKVLIAERNLDRLREGKPVLTIRGIGAATGLSVATITGLTAGRAGRIDFDTLDTLCSYFHIQPGDLLEYLPGEPAETLVNEADG